MSEYWKSSAKHFCNICKCWISGHPRNIALHEASESHNVKKETLLKKLSEDNKASVEARQQVQHEIHAMRAAALAQAGSIPASVSMHAAQGPSLEAAIQRQADRQYTGGLPSVLDPLANVLRPLEEASIAKFIASKVGHDVDAAGATMVAKEDDYRKAMLFYESVGKVPAHLKVSPYFRDARAWTEEEDFATGMTKYINEKLALTLWEKPPAVIEKEKMAAARDGNTRDVDTRDQGDGGQGDGDTRDAAQMNVNYEEVKKHRMEAALPGAWTPVTADQSVFFSGTQGLIPEETHKSSRLDDFLNEGGDERPQRAAAAADAFEEMDATLVEREVFEKGPTTSMVNAAAPKKSTGGKFKSRGKKFKAETARSGDSIVLDTAPMDTAPVEVPTTLTAAPETSEGRAPRQTVDTIGPAKTAEKEENVQEEATAGEERTVQDEEAAQTPQRQEGPERKRIRMNLR